MATSNGPSHLNNNVGGSQDKEGFHKNHLALNSFQARIIPESLKLTTSKPRPESNVKICSSSSS